MQLGGACDNQTAICLSLCVRVRVARCSWGLLPFAVPPSLQLVFGCVCVCVLRLVLGAAFSRAAPLIVLGVFVRAVFLRPGLFAIRRAALLFVFGLCAFVA